MTDSLQQPWFSLLYCCGIVDVTNEKFIVAGKSFQTIRHIINGEMGVRKIRETEKTEKVGGILM